jgi:tRNA nucleotidyltransferase (CCA-adding enzyme)
MHLILTHEQADFDAIGSLLGAYLMNGNAYPVLPRRTNRNVRAFLNLYGPELPFVNIQDLPPQSVESVTLVDTQSLVTLKGMSGNTLVHVIDHHLHRDDTPIKWNVAIENVGACTTLFVRDLSERGIPLNMVYATLLLLGIYEDTGSLTYASTTPTDARAVAQLLESNANLRIASRYLNPPLTNQQRVVYEHLLASSQKILIHGKNILIASADAEGMVDEISSIAHKIRDLLDPDGLFLLVKTDEGIRIVARSTTDQINVAEVLARFGGGGHDRAAAALIRSSSPSGSINPGSPIESLVRIKQQLIDLLPSAVHPPITVGEIMSPHPQVIAPDISAYEAATIIQKYGYEGYPVVRNGRVIGLLTRRAIDRALSHKLNLPASSLMDAGDYSVSPQDPVENLQRVMSASGWGQVPVVDKKTKKLIGIVTRTDLLKTITPPLPARDHIHLASKIDRALPPLRLALLKMIAEKAHEKNMAIFIVGGFVRDLLLDRPSFDFDLVVEGDAIQLAKYLSNFYGGKVTSHARFGTAKWNIKSIQSSLCQVLIENCSEPPQNLPDSIDLISARIEFYDYPSALPTVERSSIKLDLHRRDFTINTMAVRLDGQHYGALYDYWGGFRDLTRKFIRVLHSLSFVDDPTRLLRAVRFEQRFGFQIDNRTLQLMDDARPLVRQVSGDRIRHEMNLIFEEYNAVKMMARLEELDLLRPIHPALCWEARHEEFFSRLTQSPYMEQWKLGEAIGSSRLLSFLGYMAWLVLYPRDTILDICERLRLPAGLKQSLQSVNQLIKDAENISHLTPGEVTNRLEKTPDFALFTVQTLAQDPQISSLIEKFNLEWRKIRPYTTGEDLRRMQIAPGPHYRDILSRLRSAWIDGKITDHPSELAFLSELLNSINHQFKAG